MARRSGGLGRRNGIPSDQGQRVHCVEPATRGLQGEEEEGRKEKRGNHESATETRVCRQWVFAEKTHASGAGGAVSMGSPPLRRSVTQKVRRWGGGDVVLCCVCSYSGEGEGRAAKYGPTDSYRRRPQTAGGHGSGGLAGVVRGFRRQSHVIACMGRKSGGSPGPSLERPVRDEDEAGRAGHRGRPWQRGPGKRDPHATSMQHAQGWPISRLALPVNRVCGTGDACGATACSRFCALDDIVRCWLRRLGQGEGTRSRSGGGQRESISRVSGGWGAPPP